MRFLKIAILSIILLFLIGCKGQKLDNGEGKIFKSEKYGFSFSFPNNWDEVTKDLPDRWAITNNQDGILLTVNKAQIKDILALGKIQAVRDLYSENNINKIGQEKVDQINKIVNLKSFNNENWYTYAIKFSDKNVNSIVSGTLCGEYEINLVLVSSFGSYEDNKVIYSDILNSFRC